MPAPRKYDEETQARAVRMYAARLAEGDLSQLQARRDVGELLGINPSTLRNWIRRDLGEAATPPRDETLEAENARLRRENARLLRASEILKTAWHASGSRPPSPAPGSGAAARPTPGVPGWSALPDGRCRHRLGPAPQTRLADAQVFRDPGNRKLTRPGKLNCTTTELRRLGCRHPGLLPR